MGRFKLEITQGQPDNFNLVPLDVADPIPEDQQKIHQEAYEAANILKLLKKRGAFKNDEAAYNEFIQRVLQAAQAGCTAEHVQTSAAAKALEQIRADIMRREARPMIYRYLMAYAAWSLVGLLIGALLIIAARNTPASAGYGWAIASAAVAAWFSVAVLRSEVSFSGIQDFLDRQYEPFVRVLLVAVMTAIIALLLQFKVFALQVGPVDLAAFTDNIGSALILGIVAGIFGEKFLSVTLIERMKKALPSN
jgi:hypothetical protein